jgi:hypothetical protein
MDLFYYSDSQKKHYKVSEQSGKVWMYWVAVYATEEGGFFHGRGRDYVASMELACELMEKMGEEISEARYIQAMKDYFAIDKKVREQFIEVYKL